MLKVRPLYMASVFVLLASLVLIAACQKPAETAAAPAPAAAPPPEYTPTATVKDLMQSVVDPNADVVWLAVTTVQSNKGTVETRPKTDEEWTKVRHGAVALMEASNLLMVPGRHVAKPGEKSETPGVELEPSEMEALINKDLAAWRKRAHGLHEAGAAALRNDLQPVGAARLAPVQHQAFELEQHVEACGPRLRCCRPCDLDRRIAAVDR